MTKSPGPLTEKELVELMRDDRYWNTGHPEYLSYQAMVAREFRRTFGDGAAPVDATGRIVADGIGGEPGEV